MNKHPAGWNAAAHDLWLTGQRPTAIQHALRALNAIRPKEPRALFVQLSYYAYLSGNYVESVRFAQATLERHGPDAEIEKNTSSALLRLGNIEAALKYALMAEQHAPATPELLDLISSVYWRLNDTKSAITYGGRSLVAKDKRARGDKPAEIATIGQKRPLIGGQNNVVSFALWGAHPRYLRGCLRNAIQMTEVYPGWKMRLFAANDVPPDLLEALRELQVEVVIRDVKEPLLARLSWRFEVANDKSVNRFLVRDVDSVINLREKAAVDAWMETEFSFHVMRDWSSHTDLILAGMWGGKAGILPDISRDIRIYKSRFMETANIDQWFLGDVVWPRIASSVMIHDRYYDVLGSRPFPDPVLEWKSGHVGQDEYSARETYQADMLVQWATTIPSLKLQYVADAP